MADPTPGDWNQVDMFNREALQNNEVHSPKHYTATITKGETTLVIECIDAMVAVYGTQRVQEYCELSAFKYQWREGRKHKDTTTDKKKKIWFTRFSMGDDPRDDP